MSHSDQPKPTTGEWTAERLRQCGIESTTMAQYLCDEINAALTAEQEKVESVTRRYEAERLLREQEIQQLRNQLEAETANSTRLACELSTSQTQLAAAQAAMKDALDYYKNECSGYEPSLSVFHRKLDNIFTDTTALDAAISAAQQPLVDALRNILSVQIGVGLQGVATAIGKVNTIAKAALANVKEGKV